MALSKLASASGFRLRHISAMPRLHGLKQTPALFGSSGRSGQPRAEIYQQQFGDAEQVKRPAAFGVSLQDLPVEFGCIDDTALTMKFNREGKVIRSTHRWPLRPCGMRSIRFRSE